MAGGKSQRLKLDDLRQAFRLVGDVRELGHDPEVWRPHLLRELCRMTGAFVAVAAEIRLTRAEGMTAIAGIADVGWPTPKERARFYEYMSGGVLEDPIHPVARRRAGTGWTVRRVEVVDDRAWYASRGTSEYRRSAGTDDTLTSHGVLPDPDWTHVISLHRPWGAAPFTSFESRLLNVVHEELARLWRADAGGKAAGGAGGNGRAEPDPMASLSPRQRDVLRLLRAGDAEKQVARRLGISRHTVHGHVKELHRIFGASSRAELLARSRPVRPAPTVRLSSAP